MLLRRLFSSSRRAIVARRPKKSKAVSTDEDLGVKERLSTWAYASLWNTLDMTKRKEICSSLITELPNITGDEYDYFIKVLNNATIIEDCIMEDQESGSSLQNQINLCHIRFLRRNIPSVSMTSYLLGSLKRLNFQNEGDFCRIMRSIGHNMLSSPLHSYNFLRIATYAWESIPSCESSSTIPLPVSIDIAFSSSIRGIDVIARESNLSSHAVFLSIISMAEVAFLSWNHRVEFFFKIEHPLTAYIEALQANFLLENPTALEALELLEAFQRFGARIGDASEVCNSKLALIFESESHYPVYYINDKDELHGIGSLFRSCCVDLVPNIDYATRLLYIHRRMNFPYRHASFGVFSSFLWKSLEQSSPTMDFKISLQHFVDDAPYDLSILFPERNCLELIRSILAK